MSDLELDGLVLSIDPANGIITLRISRSMPRGSGDIVSSVLQGRGAASVQAAPVAAGITIGATAAVITDSATGKYPHKNPFRDELLRSLAFAADVWGAETAWTAIDESHWTALLRRRCEQLVAKNCKAVRATEITVSRLITVVGWLRDTKRIPRDAAPWPRSWKADVAKHWQGVVGSDRAPKPERLRYTLAEFQAILEKSDFDPRLSLLLRLAVGLRPGQVARARRSDLQLPPVDWQVPAKPDDDYGWFEVHGAGKKGGAIVDLTRGQRLALEHALTQGYLAQVDARFITGELKDYVLFPSGYVVGRVGMLRGQETTLALSDVADFTRHVSSSWIRKSWRTAETRAGIEHITGRCTYGQRRLTVDVGVEDGLSPSGIQGLGGWTTSAIPLAVYREGENRTGRREARPIRARMLGESEEIVTAIEQRADAYDKLNNGVTA